MDNFSIASKKKCSYAGTKTQGYCGKNFTLRFELVHKFLGLQGHLKYCDHKDIHEDPLVMNIIHRPLANSIHLCTCLPHHTHKVGGAGEVGYQNMEKRQDGEKQGELMACIKPNIYLVVFY